MGNIVNLKLYRKVKAREEKEREAEANRAKHGRTKIERLRTGAEDIRKRDHLDALKRDRAPPESPADGE